MALPIRNAGIGCSSHPGSTILYPTIFSLLAEVASRCGAFADHPGHNLVTARVELWLQFGNIETNSRFKYAELDIQQCRVPSFKRLMLWYGRDK